ncbi:unnamed protein product [Rhodiola kirilowii]
MGKKAGSLRINPKKFGSMNKPCLKETIAFLNCLALNNKDDEKCVRQKDLLNSCMNDQATKKKNLWGSVNYHLQKLSRVKK